MCRHNDMHHLSKLLSEAPAKKRKLVVTDSLFSMDGNSFLYILRIVQKADKSMEEFKKKQGP